MTHHPTPSHPWKQTPVASYHQRRNHEAARALDPTRNRLDLRLTPECRSELNDLIALINVSAAEVVRRAIFTYHGLLVAPEDSGKPVPLPSPPKEARRKTPGLTGYTCHHCGHRGLLDTKGGESTCLICERPILPRNAKELPEWVFDE